MGEIILAIVLGFALALIVAFVKKSKLKSVHFERNAQSYVKAGSMNITYQQDVFINRMTTSRHIERDND